MTNVFGGLETKKYVHFGLGTVTKIDSVEVRWPNGRIETFENLSVDAIRILKEGSGMAESKAQKKP